MATRAEVEQYRRAQSGAAGSARAELLALWAALNVSGAQAAMREQAVELFRGIVDVYGDMSAMLAAEFYESLREQAGVPGAAPGLLADPVPDEVIESAVEDALYPLENWGDEAKTLSRLEQKAGKFVLQQGRDTISESADVEGARWMRVPTGAETCAFCLVMASRGPVYSSEATAGGLPMTAYHYDCDCAAVPFWDGDALPEGYDPQALTDIYTEARGMADRKVLKRGEGGETVLTVLRREFGYK